jgi:hypothetical protein
MDMMDRGRKIEFLRQHVKTEMLIKHLYAVEAVLTIMTICQATLVPGAGRTVKSYRGLSGVLPVGAANRKYGLLLNI